MDKKQNLENLIFDIFDKEIDGADVYHNNGSNWIIFTEEKRWITEFTETKTLWYNYQHFNELLVYFGMDASESTKYIKKWYEERFIFKPKVENIIQNGVKYTGIDRTHNPEFVEDAIQNGMKDTRLIFHPPNQEVENTIQNGVKRTLPESIADSFAIEDTIQNGVKSTFKSWNNNIASVENTIQNGVKHILDKFHFRKRRVNRTCKCQDDQQFLVENTIQNGVKDTINIM